MKDEFILSDYQRAISWSENQQKIEKMREELKKLEESQETTEFLIGIHLRTHQVKLSHVNQIITKVVS